jgi:twitching motility protein PilI
MANPVALRELQRRLAERLQAARTQQGTKPSWLAVECGGGRYLCPLEQAGEIFAVAPVQAVAYTAPWFLGVANLRGGLYGIVHLGAFLTRDAAAGDATGSAGRGEPTAGEASLVSFNPVFEVNAALLVDRLAGLRGEEAFARSEPPAAGAPAWFGSRRTDAQGTAWQELDLRTLATDPAFLGIAT